MNDSPRSGRRLSISFLTILILAVVPSVVLQVATSRDSKQWELITRLSAVQVGEGRLFRSFEKKFDDDDYREALVQAHIEILVAPESDLRSRLEALVDLGNKNLNRAANTLQRLRETHPNDPEILNDLGVVLLAMADSNVLHVFQAAEFFDRARKASLQALAPISNSALAYRRIQIDQLTATPIIQKQNDFRLLEQLDDALKKTASPPAADLFKANSARYRKIAFDRLLTPSGPVAIDSTIDFILRSCEGIYDDQTTAAMAAPIRANNSMAMESRRLIKSAIDAYQRSDFARSSTLYAEAENFARKASSIFDELWLQLNRGDTELRLGHRKEALQLFDNVIAQARPRNYKWLLGKAMAAKGGDSTLVANYDEVLQILNEAANTLTSVGAPQDASRATYYLSSAYSFAGDFETALNFTYQALSQTSEEDFPRRGQLHWVAGLQAYRLGFPQYAIPLEETGVREAKNSPGLTGFIAANLALLHLNNRDSVQANKYAALAKEANSKLPPSRERTLNELIFNLACARINLEGRNAGEAEKCLVQNIALINTLPDKAPNYLAQTLLQLSDLYQGQGKLDIARERLAEAVKVIETNDALLAAGILRLSFENERRAVYDRAIALEFSEGNANLAWRYEQGFRSKLFLEFLGRMNTGIGNVHNLMIDLASMKQLVPPNVQIVEYAVLPKQLLIWVVSKHGFRAVSVPIERGDLERKVAALLEQIQKKGNVEERAAELHQVLIDPIEDQLDPRQALAIIPDQALHRLNFPALYSKSKGSYLIERYALLENPSLTSLLSGSGETPRRENVVAFGAQTDDTNATKELASLQKYYSGIQSFNLKTALKPAFLSSMETAGILHYAGHSTDASDPLTSAILLDGKQGGVNGVTAVDITKHRMPPNSVVVLASCDSSVGNSRDGIGMRGLTSAFLISGAGSVVGSLWLVEANNTSDLVLKFHKGFSQEKLSVAESLRKAQLAFIAEGKHPYYWSGFVVTGNLSALR